MDRFVSAVEVIKDDEEQLQVLEAELEEARSEGKAIYAGVWSVRQVGRDLEKDNQGGQRM